MSLGIPIKQGQGVGRNRGCFLYKMISKGFSAWSVSETLKGEGATFASPEVGVCLVSLKSLRRSVWLEEVWGDGEVSNGIGKVIGV